MHCFIASRRLRPLLTFLTPCASNFEKRSAPSLPTPLSLQSRFLASHFLQIETLVRDHGIVCINRPGSDARRFVYETDLLSKYEVSLVLSHSKTFDRKSATAECVRAGEVCSVNLSSFGGKFEDFWFILFLLFFFSFLMVTGINCSDISPVVTIVNLKSDVLQASCL